MELIGKNFTLLVSDLPTADILDCLIEQGFGYDESINIRKILERDPKEANRRILEKIRFLENGPGILMEILKSSKDTHMNYIYKKMTGVKDIQHTKTVTEAYENASGVEISQSNLVSSSNEYLLDIAGITLNESDAPQEEKGRSEARGNFESDRPRSPGENSDHEYEDLYPNLTVKMTKVANIEVCGRFNKNCCPQVLSALKTDDAWREGVDDDNIHGVAKDLSKNKEGAYIVWYSVRKKAVLVSIAMPCYKKGHVHFKLKQSPEDKSYYFDSTFKNKDPVKVLEHAKARGLRMKPAKAKKYQKA